MFNVGLVESLSVIFKISGYNRKLFNVEIQLLGIYNHVYAKMLNYSNNLNVV